MVESQKPNFECPRSNAALALCVCAFLAVSAAADGEPPDREAKRAMMHAVQAGEVRRVALEDAAGLVKKGWFSPAAADAWRATVADADPDKMKPRQFAPPQIADFFAGAQVLPGPYDAAGAVFAYYNPWWDALLFIRTSGGKLPEGAGGPPSPAAGKPGEPTSPAAAASRGGANFLLEEAEDEKAVPAVQPGAKAVPEPPRGKRGVPPKVDSFAWVSGETFRGEIPSDGRDRLKTVLPAQGEPMSKALWRAEAATLARFRGRFPEGGGHAVQFDTGVAGASFADEFPVIQSRAALRLKLASELLGDKTNAAVCARCCALIRSAGERELMRNFDSRQHRFFCRTLAKIPAKVREGFIPYGFVPGAEGSLFVFVNKDMPRYYATVSFPKGRLSGPFAGAVEMEWYDLGEAAGLLEAASPSGGRPSPAAGEGGAQ